MQCVLEHWIHYNEFMLFEMEKSRCESSAVDLSKRNVVIYRTLVVNAAIGAIAVL